MALEKPQPDSREWWQEVAQGLAIKLFEANRKLEAAALAPAVVPHDLCVRCGYQRFRHNPFDRHEHSQTMPAAEPICYEFQPAAPPVVAPVAAPVVPSVDEILRNMISGEESCARPRPAYLRALRDVRKVLAAAPPVVAPVAHEHVYRMDPVTETAFCECGQTVTLAESVAPVAAPVQEQE